MTLREKQSLFARIFARLIMFANDSGYEITIGEVWRPPFTAEHYASTGQGIAGSLHEIRLAADINLFKDGVWLTKSEDFEPLGLWWEAADALCRWGGRFGDGNHFSITHNGKR